VNSTGCRIAAVAHALPGHVVSNQAIIDAQRLRLKDAWVRANIGIEERRWCGEGETTSHLAAAVCTSLLERTGLRPGDVSRLIVATVSPDVMTPSTACIAQSIFAAGSTFPCVDVVAACSGFVFALDLARRCVQTGDERVLCVAAEVRSAFLDKQDRRTVMLFGDAAAGVLLERCRPGEVGVVSTRAHSDGRYWDAVSVPAGGVRRPASAETVAQREHCIAMKDGGLIFERAVAEMADLAARTVAEQGLGVGDVDFFVFHQASGAIVAKACERLGVPPAKTHVNFARYGNTTAASVPLALSEARDLGLVRPGQLVLLVATGGGFTAGSALLRWEEGTR